MEPYRLALKVLFKSPIDHAKPGRNHLTLELPFAVTKNFAFAVTKNFA